MKIQSVDIEGFRSLRDLAGRLDQVTVLVGPNGVGKSNLYRALELIHLAATRQLSRAISGDGGISNIFWAGAKIPKSQKRIRLKIEWDELEYELVIGISSPTDRTSFPQDPYIKTEKIWSKFGRRTEMVRRAGQVLKYRDDQGHWRTYPPNLGINESMLSQLREPKRFPLCLSVANEVLNWRFYHTFRADPESPLRKLQPVFRAPFLDSDGGNLVATLMTIREGRNQQLLGEIIGQALPDAKLQILGSNGDCEREIGIAIEQIGRKLRGRELSDGTLRMFALVAALLSEEMPDLLVLNEPETSLHFSTFPALAKAISHAATRTQILIVTHSRKLADEIARHHPALVRKLRWDAKRGTRIDSQIPIDEDYDPDKDPWEQNDDPYDPELNSLEES